MIKPTPDQMRDFIQVSSRVTAKCEKAIEALHSYPRGTVPASISGAVMHMSDWLKQARTDESIDALFKAERFADAVLAEKRQAE